jgi:hypothetical protein
MWEIPWSAACWRMHVKSVSGRVGSVKDYHTYTRRHGTDGRDSSNGNRSYTRSVRSSGSVGKSSRTYHGSLVNLKPAFSAFSALSLRVPEVL